MIAVAVAVVIGLTVSVVAVVVALHKRPYGIEDPLEGYPLAGPAPGGAS